MQIERWTGPPVDTHTYLVRDEGTGEAWAIDAPLETARSVEHWLRGRKLALSGVLLTHARIG